MKSAESFPSVELQHARSGFAGIIVPMVVAFEASEEGTYTIELIVDDAPPGTQPIHIARGLPA
jgi:hypothetical protein